MRHQHGLALVVTVALAGACSSGGTGSATGTLPLRTVTDLDLPGNTSRFDYASLDTTRHRLYVSHLGASQIVVIDTHRPTVERTLDNVASVHGVLAVPALNRLYAAATGTNQAVTYDATPTGRAPEGLAYDPDTNAVYLSNEAGTTVTEIDATTGAARREIDIGGEAGNVAYDPATNSPSSTPLTARSSTVTTWRAATTTTACNSTSPTTAPSSPATATPDSSKST
jgi:DNA-binding beta-propeller fold protein YncE